MRTLLPFLLVTFLAGASAGAKPPPTRIVSDPLATYYRKHLLAEGVRGTVLVVEADFDCDGHADYAVTDSSQVGQIGAWWVIYIRRDDGRFNEIGSVGTKANRFRIARQKNGGGHLAVMLRGGPGDLEVTFYSVSHTTLRKLMEESVRISEEQTGKTRIDEIFGPNYSELPATRFSFADLQAKYPK